MTIRKEPPWAKIYFGHAIGTAILGFLLLSSKQTKSLHPYTQPILEWFPGAISISNLAPDPVSTQVFLVISLLIAACLLVWAVWHVSRGGYHTKTFETAKQRWFAISSFWLMSAFALTVLWIISHSTDGAKTRAFFLFKAATSSGFGVLTIMNQLIVGVPLAILMVSICIPFCTSNRK
jgi:hypothetical protein